MRLGIPRIRHARTVAEIVGAVLLLSAGAASAAAMAPAASPPVTIHACVEPGDHELHLRQGPTCPAGYEAISWNQTGPAGTTGIFGTRTNRATTTNGIGNQCTTGEVTLVAGTEWEALGLTPADGQLLPIGPYRIGLFSLIGTEYGGNGTTTFRLPNLKKAAPNGLTYAICTNPYNP